MSADNGELLEPSDDLSVYDIIQTNIIYNCEGDVIEYNNYFQLCNNYLS